MESRSRTKASDKETPTTVKETEPPTWATAMLATTEMQLSQVPMTNIPILEQGPSRAITCTLLAHKADVSRTIWIVNAGTSTSEEVIKEDGDIISLEDQNE